MTESVSIEVPPALIDAIVDQVAQRVRAELDAASPWMTRATAAAYLDVPISRLEKDKTVPCHAWEGRRMYHRAELDEWMRAR